MARQRSPDREKAKEMYINSNGQMKLKDIAAQLGFKDSQIRKWKSQDKWDDELKGALPKIMVTLLLLKKMIEQKKNLLMK
ncbi:phage terminase small subunit-related protein [Caloramator sp. Dgby_cultured_2]|uniref:phage terminase small subunit-related protein n=1 Tax=Caloramator sp. Dgby_cultured_2 TaxID=3029174 RepID=UPI00237EA611|nr:phage terminase small subunit-related protein [Caloramator sp. Dgby_cultured_2]WDU82288.1 phage terminase small subunit-related protein [Caloramator sp. Dgby_cultured_2]